MYTQHTSRHPDHNPRLQKSKAAEKLLGAITIVCLGPAIVLSRLSAEPTTKPTTIPTPLVRAYHYAELTTWSDGSITVTAHGTLTADTARSLWLRLRKPGTTSDGADNAYTDTPALDGRCNAIATSTQQRCKMLTRDGEQYCTYHRKH